MEKNMQTGKRIQARREELGLNLGDIAQKVGVAVSTIQRYEKGKIEKSSCRSSKPSPKPLQWTLPGCSVKPTARLPLLRSLSSTTCFLCPRPTGIPADWRHRLRDAHLADENIEAILEVPEHIRADFALRCHGDSMTGAHIHDGDIVYIRQQPDVDNGCIAAVCIDNSATLKRVYKYPDRLVLSPDNPMYEPFVYTGDELAQVRILGKAVGFTSLLD